jgi:hypothetical protein
MNLPTQNSYRLVPRGGAGLACDEEGLALGGVDLARAQTDARGLRRCVMRSPAETAKILRASYGPLRDETVLRLHHGLGRAAALIQAGDLGRAGIQAVMLGFPDLTPEAAQKLAVIADLEKAGAAWQTEPRIPAENTGGGRWTTDGGGASAIAAKPVVNVRPKAKATRAHKPKRTLRPAASSQASQPSKRPDPAPPNGAIRPTEASLVLPMGPAQPTRPVARPGTGGTIALPNVIVPPLLGGLLGSVAGGLHTWDVDRARQAVNNAISHLKLDPNRPGDQTAAAAYVWSRHFLPALIPALPYDGPELEAASQAVMRFAMFRPDAFLAATQHGDTKSFSLIIGAANGGLADYKAESKRRPEGVDPSLQTTSRAARKAIGLRLKDKSMQAHHLVPAHVWGQNVDIAALAQKAEWSPDAPSNLIALPSSPASQTAFAIQTGLTLPIHNKNHDKYNKETINSISIGRGVFPRNPTPLQARAILEGVALYNRIRIITGQYGEILRIWQ